MKAFTPYDLALTRTICRSLALRREMKDVKFLVFQDRPGVGGEQPEIFKRFWWWEDRAQRADPGEVRHPRRAEELRAARRGGEGGERRGRAGRR